LGSTIGATAPRCFFRTFGIPIQYYTTKLFSSIPSGCSPNYPCLSSNNTTYSMQKSNTNLPDHILQGTQRVKGLKDDAPTRSWIGGIYENKRGGCLLLLWSKSMLFQGHSFSICISIVSKVTNWGESSMRLCNFKPEIMIHHYRCVLSNEPSSINLYMWLLYFYY